MKMNHKEKSNLHPFIARILARRMRRIILNNPFYLHYPYSQPNSIFEVDRRVFISEELKIVFNGIGKAGHSSVLMNIAKALHGEKVTVDHAKYLSFVRPSNLTQKHMVNLADYFKFTFVRNPYTRTLSAYLDKVVRQKVVPINLQKYMKRTAPSFLDFCHYLDDGGLYDAVHWAPQSSLFVIPSSQFNFIGKLERFNEDFCHVLDWMNLNENFNLERYDSHKTDSQTLVSDHYCKTTFSIITKLMEKDFKTLNYEKNLDSL